MATTKELIEFLKLQAAQNTYEDVQGEEESPADCGNYDDAYDMGRLSGKIAFAKALVGWLEGGPKPVLETGNAAGGRDCSAACFSKAAAWRILCRNQASIRRKHCVTFAPSWEVGVRSTNTRNVAAPICLNSGLNSHQSNKTSEEAAVTEIEPRLESDAGTKE